MGRLNIERQNELEPERIAYAKNKIEALGLEVIAENFQSIKFIFKGGIVTFFPYSGWHSGKTIKDGRGLINLLKQLKDEKTE